MTANSFNRDLKDSLVKPALPFADYILVYPALKENSSHVFNFGFMAISFIILLFLFWGIYFVYKAENQEEIFIKEFKSTYGLVYDFVDKVLVIPIVGMCFSNLFCKINDSDNCRSSEAIILRILSFINFILVTIIEILFVYLFFNFTFKIKDMLSRNPSGFTIISLFFKVLIVIISVTMNLEEKGSYQMCLIIHIALGILMLVDAIGTFPYHQKNVSKVKKLYYIIILI